MLESISWDQWIAVSTSSQFLILSGIFFALPFIFYLILGAFVKGRSSSGKVTTNSAITYANWWYAPIVFDLIGLIIYIPTIVFPIWIKIF